MNTETEAIFSSTGRLGVSRRQHERLYVNGTRFSDNPAEVQQNFERLVAIAHRFSGRIGRSIFRGVTNEDVVQHALNSGLRDRLEVAAPLREFTDDSSWLIYMAHNRPGRDQIVPTDIMIRETESQHEVVASPVERVRGVLGRGYTFIDSIPENQVDQVHTLWGETFGWERHEVDNLRRRLHAVSQQDPNQRDVWFSAIRDNDTIISVAMAERLTIPAASGALNLVESTEWRTQDEYAGQGLMTATLAMLHTQVLADFQGGTHGLPLLYAECNFQSRSDRAGYGAGLRIPARTQEGYPAPQILVQNVLVRDGALVEEGRLRDFTFMYLPKDIIEREYDPAAIDVMVRVLQP